jgi:hypothetical protein
MNNNWFLQQSSGALRYEPALARGALEDFKGPWEDSIRALR